MRRLSSHKAWKTCSSVISLLIIAKPTAPDCPFDERLMSCVTARTEASLWYTTPSAASRTLFEMFDKKTGILQLLDTSDRANGVQIYIGGESGLVPLDECSVVTAPYDVDGQVVGTVGVIGPTRMAYERVIPIVDITAKLLSGALSHP